MNNIIYHLKIALRNLRKSGLYSAINIGGLAVSLAAVLLIMLWVQDELSFDRFHKRGKDIYLTVSSFDMGDKRNYWALASPPLARAAKNEIPEVDNACRSYEYWSVGFLKNGENVFHNINSAMVDTSFFSIIKYHVIEGDRNALLPDNYSVVLSESVAKALFGDESPIGKIVTDDSHRQYHVTAIVADMPKNSSIRYNVILSFSLFEYFEQNSQWGSLDSRWGNLNYKTLLLLKPGADANSVAQKITDIHRYHDNWQLTYTLLPLEKVNLYNLDGTANTKLQACRLFSIAVAVLLLIACINYVNLVTARASRRNKEVFVRNVLGARKMNIFAQFFNESLMLFLCSLGLATLLIYLFFPVYNHITGKDLEFRFFSGSTALLYGIAFVATTLFAGIYPSVSLARRVGASPRSETNTLIRRALVVLQFSASVVLILAAVTINLQMHYIRTKNPGYDKEHLFYVNVSESMRTHADNVKTLLSEVPGIDGITFTSQPLSDVAQFNSGGDWEGKGDKQVTFNILTTDKDFLPLMKIKLLEGENFSGTPADRACFILNKEAVVQMGIRDPIGKQLHQMEGVNGTIIGVTEDFHIKNMHETIGPLIIRVNPWVNYLYVKTSAGNAPDALSAVETLYKQYNADIPFSYSFVDDEFDRIYKSDIRTSKLFQIFAVIAILISCLGLFGLITYTAETKTKEIGIRKVLGASVAGIVELLSKEFLILVVIAMLIAFPLAYYFLDKMLQDYAYRINISWWMFALAGIITVALTLLTVGWKAVRAAMANPVKAIKAE